MMAWVVPGVWLFAFVFAVVTLGFLGYELSWKLRRLQQDRAQLEQTLTSLAAIVERLNLERGEDRSEQAPAATGVH
jgi:cell division protein FtsB